MLRIAKLRVGAEAYQLSGVAQGLDDYYTGRGEAPGQWKGSAAARLGLSGEVGAEDLRAVLAGLAPDRGGLTPNGETLVARKSRVPGFDLTFKVPKSASVLYAVSDDPGVQGAVIEAGEAALEATLGWLEEHAARVQRGTHNKAWLDAIRAVDPARAAAAGPRVEASNGLAVAVFRHRTSRAGDPLLHWHCLVANQTERTDGRWSALYHPALYRSARAAGERFQTVFRAELTARLGVEWRPGRHVPEIAGIPEKALEVFSKRRAQIDAWLDANGGPRDAAGQERAALATRRGKTEREGERFDAAWKTEAIGLGWGPPEAAELLYEQQPRVVPGYDEVWRLPEQWADEAGAMHRGDRLVDPDVWIADLARRYLTVNQSTFTGYDVNQAVAARLGDGGSAATLNRLVDRVLASPELVAIAAHGERRWSSRELVEVENRFLATITGAPGPDGVAEEAVAAVVAGQRSIGGDQADAVARLCGDGDGDGVRVMVGPAGTGKTYTLDVVRQVFAADGRTLVGAAPSAKAALELEGAGIDSATIHRRLAELGTGELVFSGSTVLVVDEAGMAGIRELERLVTAARQAGALVILAGDHRQLPEVTAGGGFAAAVTVAGDRAAELVVNRRQQAVWEQEALAELRAGNVAVAVDAYRTRDRVVVAGDRAELIGGAVDVWEDARTQGRRAVLVTGTVEMCSAVNAVVRDRLVAAGELPKPTIAYGERTFSVGERIMLRRNSRYERDPAGDRLAVVNGEGGIVLGGGNGELHVALDRGDRQVHLGVSYLQRGEVDHGYAITTHRAQGGTWDVTIGVGLDGLYREAAYTLLSRGREGNWLHVTGAELDRVDRELDRHNHGLPLPGEEPDIDNELRRRLSRSGAKQLALTVDPDAATVDQLAATVAHPTLVDQAVTGRRAERAVAQENGFDVEDIVSLWVRCQHTARHVAVGSTVKAYDRRNIGTVETVHDADLTCTVRFDSPDGRTATRTLDFGMLEVMQPGGTRPLSDIAYTALTRRGARIDEVLTDVHDRLAKLGVTMGEAARCERAATLQVDRAAARLRAERPDWLTALAGDQPGDLIGRRLWNDQIAAVAAWRTAQQISDDQPALGPCPQEPDSTEKWTNTHAQLACGRGWLTHRDSTVAPLIVSRRTRAQAQARLIELQDIFDTAPPDQRHLIERLTGAVPQLPLDELADALTAATNTHGERQQWILTHWPHIVEGAEIRRTLNQAAGPDIYALFDQLAQLTPHARVRGNWTALPPAWACTVLAQLAGTGQLTVEHVELIDDIHSHRERYHITSGDPFGPEPADPMHAAARARLSSQLAAHTSTRDAPRRQQVQRTLDLTR